MGEELWPKNKSANHKLYTHNSTIVCGKGYATISGVASVWAGFWDHEKKRREWHNPNNTDSPLAESAGADVPRSTAPPESASADVPRSTSA